MSYLKGSFIISKIALSVREIEDNKLEIIVDKNVLWPGPKHRHFWWVAFPKKDNPEIYEIKRSLSKEERESKVQTESLGEIALVGSKPVEISREKAEQISKKIKEEAKHKDDLPF